jgi:hypothetical protein
MSLFPRSERILEFAAHPTFDLTSRRILAARDLTNGINAVMIDCMHGVTTIILQPSIGREPKARLTSHQSRAVAPCEGSAVRSCYPVSVKVNHRDGPGATLSAEASIREFWRGVSSKANRGVCRWGASKVTVGQRNVRGAGAGKLQRGKVSRGSSFSRIGGC